MRGRGGGGGAQDFKTAHLLGVCPRQQFGAMLIGSGASVLVSVAAYQLYTSTYQVRLWHPCAVIKFLLDISINAVRSAVGSEPSMGHLRAIGTTGKEGLVRPFLATDGRTPLHMHSYMSLPPPGAA